MCVRAGACAGMCIREMRQCRDFYLCTLLNYNCITVKKNKKKQNKKKLVVKGNSTKEKKKVLKRKNNVWNKKRRYIWFCSFDFDNLFLNSPLVL